MEWCGKLYGEWKVDGSLRRLDRTVLVFLIFVMITGWVCGTEPVVPGFEEKYLTPLPGSETEIMSVISSTVAREAGKALEILPADHIPASSEILTEAAAAGCRPVSVDIADMDRDIADTVPLKPEIPMEMLPSGSETAAEVIPVVPGCPAEAVPPVSVPAGEKPVEAVPKDEGSAETVPAVVDGFFVDEYGMICGIADPTVISDGYLVLPAEGCTGITAGAFTDAPATITEIYIPANIIQIAEGAFTGLAELEWLAAEPSDNYYTEDGVLFSENGTCILGFPSARTGNYKVPVKVTRFAKDAFSDAQIEIIDAVGCSLQDTGSLPSFIRLFRTEDLKG